MDRILLERLGIGWNDSVAEANEKRMKDSKNQPMVGGFHQRMRISAVGERSPSWFYARVIPHGLPSYVQWNEPSSIAP